MIKLRHHNWAIKTTCSNLCALARFTASTDDVAVRWWYSAVQCVNSCAAPFVGHDFNAIIGESVVDWSGDAFGTWLVLLCVLHSCVNRKNVNGCLCLAKIGWTGDLIAGELCATGPHLMRQRENAQWVCDVRAKYLYICVQKPQKPIHVFRL